MFRFRLISGPFVTSWGWALDYISIQEQPLAGESPTSPSSPLVIFPNPSTGKLTLNYTLKKPSDISIRVIDIHGKSLGIVLTGTRKAGNNTENLDLSELKTGTYIVVLQTSEDKLANKVAIIR
jgi:hypothetical protein